VVLSLFLQTHLLKCDSMFCAEKNPYRVKVSFDGKQVHVSPMGVDERKGLVSRTLARCEEFMAQVFLQERRPKDALMDLTHFFRQRGWNIVPEQ
jgi:hypothetical protein